MTLVACLCSLQLDEVRLINKGYYTECERLFIGNVSTVKTDIEKQPVNNPLLPLKGRVPVLFFTHATGAPGSGVIVLMKLPIKIHGNTKHKSE